MTAPEATASGPRRWPIILVVVVVVALGLGVVAGRSHPVSQPAAVAPVDATERPGPSALSTAWYCPGLPPVFPTDDQTVTLSNLGARDIDATVTVRPDGGAAPIVRSVRVPHDSVQTFGRGSLAVVSGPTTTKTRGVRRAASTSLPPGPIVVEPFSPDVMVAAGVETATQLDTVPCANTASADWYFAAGTTVRGVSQWLVLDDPFSTDARIDVALRTDSGLQVLPSLQGIDVPGRSRVIVPISRFAVRQARVAVSVHAVVGRVVASQTLQFGRASGSTGVASTIGALAPASQWWFTDGDALAGASQWVALSNVGPVEARVAVETLVESKVIVQPVVQSVPPGEVSWVQIGGCARGTTTCLQVPADGPFAIAVQSDAKLPIVAQSLSRFRGQDTVSGAVTSMGSTVPARQWVIMRTRAVDEQSTSISALNPSVRTANVSVEVVHDGVVDRPAELQHLTIASNAQLVLPAATAGATHRDDAAVVINSDVPIFAESTIYAERDATRAAGIPAR